MANEHKTKLVNILLKEIGLSPEEAAQRAELILRETTPLSERTTLYEEPVVTRREGTAELSEAEQRIRAALESMGYGPREGAAPSEEQPANAVNETDSPAARLDQALRELRAR